jgi:DNA-binding winged helix-turn-helix (wHTH) protein/Tol biopolymer transport system component
VPDVLRPSTVDKRAAGVAAPVETITDAPATPAVDEYRFGPFRMDVASMQLWKDDTAVPLPPKAFDTLRVLIANRHRLVAKDELLSTVWPNTFVSEESVHQNITSLRRALGDDASQPTYIATVARRGYRFVGTAEPRFSAGPADRQPVAEPAAAPPRAALAPQKPVVAPGTTPAADPNLLAAYHRWRLAAVTVSVVALAALGLLGFERLRPVPTATPLRLAVGAPSDTRFFGGALSPDGSQLAIVAEDSRLGVTQLWLKPLSAQGGAHRVVPESDGAARPFWSPDGQWVGFFANGRMKKVSVEGGPVQTIAPITGPRSSGGAWGPDGTILYASYMSGIFAIPAGGGESRRITALDPAHLDIAHRWPHFLSDGRHFLYSVISTDRDRAGTYIGALDSPDTTRLLVAPGAIWAAPGYLVYVQERLLMAQAFNERTLQVTGMPITLSGDVQAPAATNNASLSASAGGLLTFIAESSQRSRLEWVSRTGQPISSVRSPIDLFNPSLSPDQSTLVAGTGRELWMVDLERNAPTRIGPGNTTSFSPDGQRLAFTAGPGGGLSELHIRDTVGATSSRLMVGGPENKMVTDWSSDGRTIVYCSMNPSSGWDLWSVTTGETATPQAVLATPFNECQARVSPDVRWLAYASDESGTWEIYVEAFPHGGSKRAISVGGGSEPQWRADGRELYYLASDGTLTAVRFDGAAGAPVSHPVRLFRIPINSAELLTRRNHYVVGSDGQRFLVSLADADRGSFGVLLNWTSAVP